MALCEHMRTSAYGEDLRWRIIWQKEGLGLNNDGIAHNLNVDKSTVHRTLQLFLSTGTVSKSPYPKHKTARKLTDPAKLFILHLVLEKPGITLYEIQGELLDTLLLEIDVSNICRCLHNNGFTRQRLQISVLQRNEFLRQCYMEEVSVYSPEMLIFLDETGADRRNTMRRCGYSMQGKLVVRHQLLFRGERLSALAFTSVDGLLDVG